MSNDDVHNKLERAFEHRDELQAAQSEARATLKPHRLTYEDNAREATNPIIWAQWRVVDAGDPLPPKLGLILGDMVHNLRSALDYTAFDAATARARRDEADKIAFPLYSTEQGFREQGDRASPPLPAGRY